MDAYMSYQVSCSPQKKELMIALLGEVAEGFEETDAGINIFCKPEWDARNAIEKVLNTHGLHYTRTEIPATNWNAVWEANFQPVQIDDFCYLRADFHPANQQCLHEIVITPKMSFGTGHHATTYMMIRAMKNISFENKHVLDFGTGTGILSILAKKMGAAYVAAIDNDQWSIANAEENIRKNDAIGVKLFMQGNPELHQMFDVILANINRNIITSNFDVLVNQLRRNGVLLLSGLLNDDVDIIIVHANKHDLKVQHRDMKENWVCLQFSRD